MKILTFLAAICFALSASATTFNFTSEGSASQTADGFKVVLDKGSGNNPPAYYTNGMRLYAKNTITVSGGNMTKISLTFAKQGSKDYAGLTASTGHLTDGGVSTSDSDLKVDVWTGSASTVTFTLGDSGQRLIKEIVINGDATGGGGGNTDPTEPDTPSGLDPDFVYPEPTMVLVPPTTVQGDAYSFIYNNIEVSCTKGAVTDSYFSAHAGFDMTFTATRPIKGIVINGFVKKGFEATSTSGRISYLTPDEDATADPVVVLTDVNSKSVTISCVKQLRCYNVEVYFEENPEATVNGGGSGSGGATTELTFDSAEAVYESEYVEMIGEENYSIFLYNDADPYYIYFALDLYPAKKDVLTGTYTWDDYTLGDYTYYIWGETDYDMTWADGGTVTISKSGNIYTIVGVIPCDNGKTYSISFSGEMPIYTDDEYYGDGDDEAGVGSLVEEAKEKDTVMYDILGRKVGKGYRGLYIQGGKKFIGR